MLENVIMSGVVFSHDPNTGSPYRVITWTEGDDTTEVTGGRGGKTWQHAALSPIKAPIVLRPIVNMIEEILKIFKNQPVDCEFAITKEDKAEKLWLLQARPLIVKDEPETPNDQAKRLSIIAAKVDRGLKPHPFLMGRRTVYGVMPDWNPAEIVGVRPRPLALSLYRELITDAIWAYQRNNYGYRNLRSFPLMPHFFGVPYIDVRLSFNSFVPSDLENKLASRLVDYYIDRLLKEPKLHDKVEFEIVYSCYTLDLPKRLKRLRETGFTQNDCESITDSLRKLTNRIVHPKNGLWRQDEKKLEILRNRRDELMASASDPLERIYWLLEDVKRYGTLPFAGLARAGFVAIQILKSLIGIGVFSEADYDLFMSSISTVSGQLARDRSQLDKNTFLSQYGHLRPGTYDILSPRYDEAPDLYFSWAERLPIPPSDATFSLTLQQMSAISKLLEEHGLTVDVVSLLNFLQSAIELREYSKFHFSRNLSDALSLIAEYGERLGYSKEELSYCDVSVFKELHIAALDPIQALDDAIRQGHARYKETLNVSLPPVITSANDVWAFEWPETEPNFITQKEVSAEIWTGGGREKLAGKIVCIQNADPGYDWIFSYPIAGLITAWGGANSHMAIRAGELSVPAVIGAGEILYRSWSNSKRLKVDCANRKVTIIH